MLVSVCNPTPPAAQALDFRVLHCLAGEEPALWENRERLVNVSSSRHLTLWKTFDPEN